MTEIIRYTDINDMLKNIKRCGAILGIRFHSTILRTSEHRSMYSYVRLSIIDVQLRTSEHRSMYSYVL
mgnify:CR=1 FL=1